jgi:tRNA pseudouridine55 synthase
VTAPRDTILVVDKPVGPTSADVVARVRKAVERVTPGRAPGRRGQIKTGHAGTLDPMASGVLVVCLGESTKLAQFLLGCDKVYRATVRLGQATDTLDAHGQVVAESPAAPLAALVRADVEAALERFRGPILQVPPMYSALKRDGRPLYELAREGQEVEREARHVTIHRLEVLAWRPAGQGSGPWPELDLEVACSSGTYIRTLADDLGTALGVHGHLSALRRTRAGAFDVAGALDLEALPALLAEGRVHGQGWTAALAHLPLIPVEATLAWQIRCGQPLLAGSLPSAAAARRVVLVDPPGDLVAVVSPPGTAAGLRPDDRMLIDRAFNVPGGPRLER